MKNHLPHHSLYFLLAIAIKVYLVLLYGYLVGCVLLALFVKVDLAYGLLLAFSPWFAKGGLTLVYGMGVVAVLESVRA